MVVTQNIVRAAAWLLFTLAGTAGIFFLLGADFVGATQLLVYVGGTLVLVVFGVMLTAQGPFINMKISAAEWAIAAVGRPAALRACWPSACCIATKRTTRRPDASQRQTVGRPASAPAASSLGEALLGVDEATPTAGHDRRAAGRSRGRATPMAYLLPFEIVSVHLLVVLIGAAYLARAKRRRGERVMSPDDRSDTITCCSGPCCSSAASSAWPPSATPSAS